MSHAFDPILARRQRRQRNVARARHLAWRGARWLIPLLGTAFLVAVLAGLAEARFDPSSRFHWPWRWVPRLSGREALPIAPLTGSLLVLFVGGWLTVVGLALLRALLRVGYGPLAVARSVIDEAVRNKVVLVLLALLLIILAWQPFSSASTSPELRQPLRYQIQSFLSFSSMATALLLGAVTILFAASSVSQDINVRRSGDVFVKPIGRFGYLLGKWLGIVGIMAVILTAQTVVTWGVARLWLGTTYALDPLDLMAINQRVLIARGVSIPQPERPFDLVARERLASVLRERPESTEELIEQRGLQHVLTGFEIEERGTFLNVPVNETRTYVFTGLGNARERALALDQQLRENAAAVADRINQETRDNPNVPQMRPEDISLETVGFMGAMVGLDVQEALLQWRFKVKGVNSYSSLTGAMVVKVNGVTLSEPVTFVVDEIQVRDLPATYVNEDGELRIEIQNSLPDSNGNPRPIQFDADEGIQVFYVEGGFAGNLVRGAIAHWVRLAFLAMLGLVTGALWSFPVAATFALSVWLLAAGGTWLDETLATRVQNVDVAALDQALNRGAMPLVRSMTRLLSTYSRLDVPESLVEGMYITPMMLADHTLAIGVVWMGLALAIGGYLFRRREIARVQV